MKAGPRWLRGMNKVQEYTRPRHHRSTDAEPCRSGLVKRMGPRSSGATHQDFGKYSILFLKDVSINLLHRSRKGTGCII